jgi:polyisoprenoid-binding protein YceI
MTTTNQDFVSTSRPAVAPAASYQIDPAHSRASFAIRHMMVATVRGEFGKLAGTVTLDDVHPERSRIEATIEASSLNTHNEKRDNHLRSADFFDVANFPQLTFRSTAVRAVGPETYAVTGELTIHGVTRQVVLDVESPAVEVKDPYGNTKRGATATATINRKEFGLGWNQALEAGGVMVGDAVRITIDLELARQ